MAKKDEPTNQFFALDHRQFQALLDSRGGQARNEDQRGIRAPELDAVDFSKWRTWKERFLATVEINGWSHARARREMAVCITGEARDLISSVNLMGAMQINQDFRPVLQDIENLIIPSSDSDMTQAQLVSAKQEPNEDILKWRSRIRTLWMRAHPTQTVAESKDSRDLIDLFLKGLARESTKTQTWAFLPRTLTAAAQRAQNIEAGAHIFGTINNGSSPSISALQDRKRTCLACEKPGHILKDCRMWKAFRAKAGTGTQGKGKGKAIRGKGKAKARGSKGGQGNMRAIAGLQESQEEDWLNGDVDPEAETEVEDDGEEEEEDQESGNA